MKFPIITLCGSTMFKDDFFWIAEKLTLEGNIVLMPVVFSHSDRDIRITPQDEQILRDIHREKIRMSDKVVVINRDDYIGSNTQMEICYASSIGIPVEYAYPHDTVSHLFLKV